MSGCYRRAVVPKDEMRRACIWPFRRSLAATALVLSLSSAGYGEGGWQWRVNKTDDGRLLLAFTETEATDELGTLWFYCRPASGLIDVFNVANDKERKVLADFVRSNAYPKVQLESEEALVEPTYSEVDGWGYRFQIGADGAAFNKFKQTGRIGFKLGSVVADYGKDPITKSGLKKVAEYQAQCRKLAVDGAPPGTKAQR